MSWNSCNVWCFLHRNCGSWCSVKWQHNFICGFNRCPCIDPLLLCCLLAEWRLLGVLWSSFLPPNGGWLPRVRARHLCIRSSAYARCTFAWIWKTDPCAMPRWQCSVLVVFLHISPSLPVLPFCQSLRYQRASWWWVFESIFLQTKLAIESAIFLQTSPPDLFQMLMQFPMLESEVGEEREKVWHTTTGNKQFPAKKTPARFSASLTVWMFRTSCRKVRF